MHELVTVFPAREYITDEEHIREAIHDIELELEDQIKYFRHEEEKLIEAQRALNSARATTLKCCERLDSPLGSKTTHATLIVVRRAARHSRLIDYLPEDHLLFIDESHMTVPQIRGMFNGDRQRKQVLVELWLPPAQRAWTTVPLKLRGIREAGGANDLYQRDAGALRDE